MGNNFIISQWWQSQIRQDCICPRATVRRKNKMVMSQISILERISLGRTIQCLLLIRVVNIKSVL